MGSVQYSMVTLQSGAAVFLYKRVGSQNNKRSTGMSSRGLLARARQLPAAPFLSTYTSTCSTSHILNSNSHILNSTSQILSSTSHILSSSTSQISTSTASCYSISHTSPLPLSFPLEVEVEVPWGKIAGLQWSIPQSNLDQKQGKPVPWLGLHGLMDNLGTFDRLLPGLPPGIQITCLDLPGHGLSSPLPSGMNYTWLDSVSTIHRAMLSLGLEQPVLLGHSMGGWLAQIYAALFPDKVRAVISLDGVKPVSREPADMIPRVRGYIKGSSVLEKKGEGKPRPMSEAAALDRLFRGTNELHGEGSITMEAAKCLVKRGTKGAGEDGKIVFTKDRRHQLRDLPGLPHEYCQQLARSISCPHLLVRASAENAATSWGKEKAAMEDVIQIYKGNPEFKLVEVEGSHHVHLNQPDEVILSDRCDNVVLACLRYLVVHDLVKSSCRS